LNKQYPGKIIVEVQHSTLLLQPAKMLLKWLV